jgi:hypothetical protein
MMSMMPLMFLSFFFFMASGTVEFCDDAHLV